MLRRFSLLHRPYTVFTLPICDFNNSLNQIFGFVEINLLYVWKIISDCTQPLVGKYVLQVSDEVQQYTLISTIMETFASMACIIAEILLILFMAYRNRNS